MSKIAAVLARVAASMADRMEGNVPGWIEPYNQTGPAVSHNPVNEVTFSGVNRMMLGAATDAFGYERGAYASYTQWRTVGCQVKKGQKSVLAFKVGVSKCCPDAPPDDSVPCGCGNTRKRYVGCYSVFNAEQVFGEPPVDERFTTAPSEWDNIQVRDVFRDLGADWREDDSGPPRYMPAKDRIVTPPAESVDDVGAYASLIAHEFAHWSGHPSRCSRWTPETAGGCGAFNDFSEDRAEEELVAELGAQMIVNTLGLAYQPLVDSAEYVKHWAGMLRAEDGGKLLIRVGARAHRTVERVIGGVDARVRTHRRQRQAAPPDVYPAEPALPPVESRIRVGEWLVAKRVSPEDAEGAKAAYAKVLQLEPEHFNGGSDEPTADDLRMVERWWKKIVSEDASSREEAAESVALVTRMLAPDGPPGR